MEQQNKELAEDKVLILYLLNKIFVFKNLLQI